MCRARAAPGRRIRRADSLINPNLENYPDLETLTRGLLAAGPLRRVVRALGDKRSRQIVAAAFAPKVAADGSSCLSDECRLLIARTSPSRRALAYRLVGLVPKSPSV